VVQLLKAAAAGKEGESPREAPQLVSSASEAPLFTSVLKGRNKLVLELRLDSSATDEEFVEAFRMELADKRRR
jgi:hypothetical protein